MWGGWPNPFWQFRLDLQPGGQLQSSRKSCGWLDVSHVSRVVGPAGGTLLFPKTHPAHSSHWKQRLSSVRQDLECCLFSLTSTSVFWACSTLLLRNWYVWARFGVRVSWTSLIEQCRSEKNDVYKGSSVSRSSHRLVYWWRYVGVERCHVVFTAVLSFFLHWSQSLWMEAAFPCGDFGPGLYLIHPVQDAGGSGTDFIKVA